MNLLLPCIGAVIILVITLGIIVLIRYLSYWETISLAEQGLSRPGMKRRSPLFLWGFILTVLGLVLTGGLYTLGFGFSGRYPLHLGPWMLGGLIPLFLGLGLLLLHYLTARE